MRLVHLRVKIKSLATEQRIIRDEERRAIGGYRKAARDRRLAAANGTRIQDWSRDVDEAEEAQRRERAYGLFWSLRRHRWGLGSDVRIALLAYAVLRGRAYAVVEQQTDTPPQHMQWDEIRATAARFGAQAAQIDTWMAAAREHYAAQYAVRRSREKVRAAAAAAA